MTFFTAGRLLQIWMVVIASPGSVGGRSMVGIVRRGLKGFKKKKLMKRVCRPQNNKSETRKGVQDRNWQEVRRHGEKSWKVGSWGRASRS